jgi:hypothetical protein
MSLKSQIRDIQFEVSRGCVCVYLRICGESERRERTRVSDG